MMLTDLSAFAWRVAVTTTIAVIVCLLLRRPVRAWLGAPAAYAVWSCVPLAIVAAVVPGPPAATAALSMPLLRAQPQPHGTPVLAPGWESALGIAWLVGAVAMAGWLWWQQSHFVRSLGPLRAQGNAVWSASHDRGLPASLGVWRPRIVVPADFATRYSGVERQLIVAHERLHLRRGDLQANLFAAALLCLGWCNPLVHLAWRAFRLDQELACDAGVLARHPRLRRRYADAMLKTHFGSAGAATVCHWTTPHALVQRIAALRALAPRGRTAGAALRRWNTPLVMLLALLASAAAWAAIPTHTPAVTHAGSTSRPPLDYATLTPPRYPKDAMDAGLEGSVELKIRMDASGIPQQIVILRSQPAGVFDAAVLAAARQWRLVPDKVHGRPVPTTVRVPVQFALDPPDEVAAPPGTDAPAAAGTQPARCAASACAAKKG